MLQYAGDLRPSKIISAGPEDVFPRSPNQPHPPLSFVTIAAPWQQMKR